MARIAGVALIVLALTACAPVTVKDEQSPYSRIATGSTITLQQPIDIPRHAARVFIQDGRVVSKTRMNIYYPHCNFEVRTLSDGTARIEPDAFLVTGFRLGYVTVVRRAAPLQVASTFLMLADEDDGGPPPISRFVHYQLGSERQPDVMRLTCHGGFADEWEARYPSVAEIRQVLDGIASFD
ncbi:hypothetical protein B1C78_09235 [Thioalkalivibrio denitrificans]|uniref:Lipoprotein n=1 Tax=Thioalkalivibrio denitrificans TaxID=108003 RepID=A0A1V3NGZ0_9GAMM|nr:hypothetical protein [Thioalkalivibrio denitrificans]OOG24213.1 hypothetical protein B1C78_09235 [Thioalkalivibrio denitrificans]